LSTYNPYAPPAEVRQVTSRAARIGTLVAVSTLATSAFWAVLGLGLWASHRGPSAVWEDGQIALAVYTGIAFPWSLAAGAGLLRKRRWGWRVATGYFALTLLLVLLVLIFAEPVTPMSMFLSMLAASLVASVLLLLPSVRKHFTQLPAPGSPSPR